MCAMTGLNIQFLVLFGDGVVRWHVFIRILRYYSTKLAGSIVKILCKTKVLAGTATLSRNDLKELCNTKCCGWSGTLPSFGTECHLLPHRGEGMCNYNLIKDENHPSSQSSLIIKGVSNSHPELVSGSCDMLKHGGQFDVLHDKTNPPYPQSLPWEIEAEKLTSHFTLHTSLRRKAAFTLAEVLITLGIIGVVAAMTLPVLIANHQKQVTIARLKKIYSVLSQQILFANTQDVPANEFLTVGNKVSAEITEDYFQTYWIPYFKGASIIKGNPYGSYGMPDSCQYKIPNGNCYRANIYTSFNSGRILFSTNDGYILYISIMKWSGSGDDLGDALFSASQQVLVDINGLRGPNVLGKDIFKVVMNYDKNNVMPSNIDQNIDTINKNCSKTGNGESCFAKIVKDGWKISDDYPW